MQGVALNSITPDIGVYGLNDYLVIGGEPPRVPGLALTRNVNRSCAGILVLGRVISRELADALAEAGDPALPIADFAGNPELRRDFIGERFDAPAVQLFRKRSAPILRRLRQLPCPASDEDRGELTLLRLAYSRDVAIEASFAPDAMSLVDYRLIGRQPGVRQHLEGLAELGMLRRRFFTRTHACSRCGSSRLHAFEACFACGSGDLAEEPIVHHYRCAWQAPESHFVHGRLLICPKCRRELRHFGVDYGKPGIAVRCRACGAVGNEPSPNFACLDCAATIPTGDSHATDWYHYDLTEDAIRALRAGRLPRLIDPTVHDDARRAFSLREFRLLAAEAVRVGTNYSRPFAVGRLSATGAALPERGADGASREAAFSLALEITVGRVRETDFVAADNGESILIGFPETSAPKAAELLTRIKNELAATIVPRLEFVTTVAEGDAIRMLLGKD